MISLSPDQEEAYEAVLIWARGGSIALPTITLAGLAGTGKSTIVSLLAHELPEPLAFCAYTGKAASVLRRKLSLSGIETVGRVADCYSGGPAYCGTIHGLVYKPCDCRERDRTAECLRCGGSGFLKRGTLDRDYELIVVDEASMVGDGILNDLLSFNTPILAVGDHGQLPPVSGEGRLMREPDLVLEKIHRQAEKNPIIALAHYARTHGGDLNDSLEDGAAFRIEARRNLEGWIKERYRPGHPLLSSALICWTNRQRVELNRLGRDAFGSGDNLPSVGEPVICLRNRPPVYNGMRGVLDSNAIEMGKNGEKLRADVNFPEDDLSMPGTLLWKDQFLEEKTVSYENARGLGRSLDSLGHLFDFAYAMTCHKMQGSSCEDVGVLIEPGLKRMRPEERARWVYSAITRASSRICIFR